MDHSGRPAIGDILARIDLAALLDELAAPAAGHSGRARRWHCPVAGHDDAHPSVTMYTDGQGHQRWRCWSGADDHRGDAIDLIVAVHRLSRRDAITWLANRIGHTATPTTPRPRPAADRSNAPVALDPTVVIYTQRCAQLLWTATGAPVRRWLHERGFNDDVLRVNQIGADPGRRALARRPGLPAGSGPAATFPALDTTGTIRYVQTRYLNPRAGQPKYDNPASRLASNPRLAWLRPPIPRDHPHLVICEGIPDALTAAQAGFRAAAMLGSHAADHHVARALADYANAHRLTLSAIVDADPAGRGAGERLAALLAAHNTTLRIVEPPDGLDLNSWAQRDPNWTTTLAPDTPVDRSRALVRHQLLTALRVRAANGRHTAPDRLDQTTLADNEATISRLESKLDQLEHAPGGSRPAGGRRSADIEI